jgi:hypothetical protein
LPLTRSIADSTPLQFRSIRHTRRAISSMFEPGRLGLAPMDDGVMPVAGGSWFTLPSSAGVASVSQAMDVTFVIVRILVHAADPSYRCLLAGWTLSRPDGRSRPAELTVRSGRVDRESPVGSARVLQAAGRVAVVNGDQAIAAAVPHGIASSISIRCSMASRISAAAADVPGRARRSRTNASRSLRTVSLSPSSDMRVT